MFDLLFKTLITLSEVLCKSRKKRNKDYTIMKNFPHFIINGSFEKVTDDSLISKIMGLL
jgi:hypothetical protein